MSESSDVLPLGSASRTTSLPPDARYSNTPQFKVFISHAGEDKATIAIPLRDMLAKQHISAFVDDCDIPRGTDAIDAIVNAMKTAHIALFVLSPEFVARRWPIRELMHFLNRHKQCGTSREERLWIIPFFYRLSVKEIDGEPKFDRVDKNGKNLYKESRFHERRENGEPEADPDAIKQALKALLRFMGNENFVDATNDPSHSMKQRRDVLLEKLCTRVCEVARITEQGPTSGQDPFIPYSGRNTVNSGELNRRANLFRDGARGVERNAKEAVELYRCAIESGSVRAMNNLATLLKSGAEGVQQNVKEAVELYRRAIEAGNVEAMNNMANLLAHGADGVERNAKEAEELYRRAIEGGNDRAMNNLANLLTHGADGVDQNRKEAEELYRRAIESGNDRAVNNLANLLR